MKTSYYYYDSSFHSLSFQMETQSLMISWHTARGGLWRSGGSAGPTSINRDLFNFLHLPGSLPRKTHGTVIVQTERKYFIYYCSPYKVDCTVKCVHYWQPHCGSKCRTFPSKLIEKHSGLRSFVASKIATAYCLRALESEYCVAQEAVAVEFSKIEASIQEGDTLGSHAFFWQVHRIALWTHYCVSPCWIP